MRNGKSWTLTLAGWENTVSSRTVNFSCQWCSGSRLPCRSNITFFVDSWAWFRSLFSHQESRLYPLKSMMLLCKDNQSLLPFFQSLNLLNYQCNLLSGPALLSLIWVKKWPTGIFVMVYRKNLLESRFNLCSRREWKPCRRQRRTLIIKCHWEVAESSAVQLNSRYSSC